MFQKNRAHLLFVVPGEVASFVTDEVVNANRCLAIGEDISLDRSRPRSSKE
jgi:hypothetical protein